MFIAGPYLSAAAGRALIPGGDALSAESPWLSLALRAAEPSAAVGLPITVATAVAGASATFNIPGSAAGAAFAGGPGAMVVSVAHYRQSSPVAALAAEVLGERLVSRTTSLAVSHPSTTITASAAVPALDVTLAFDRALRDDPGNAGRYPDVMFYDAARWNATLKPSSVGRCSLNP
jgi:hypothetical protein